MLPVAGKLRIEPESETATREPFLLPMYPELTRERRGYAVDAVAEFSRIRDRQLHLGRLASCAG